MGDPAWRASGLGRFRSLISSLIHVRLPRSITGHRRVPSRSGDQRGQPWTVMLNPEKRKVGGSTPPLTTTSDLRVYAASDHFRFQQAPCSLTSVSLTASGRLHARRSSQLRVSLSTGTDCHGARSACLLAERMPANYSPSIRPPKNYRHETLSPMQFSPGQQLARYWPTRQRPAECRGKGRRRTSILRWRRCARSCCPRPAEDQ